MGFGAGFRTRPNRLHSCRGDLTRMELLLTARLPAVTRRGGPQNCAPLTGSVRIAHRRTASTACAGELFPRLNAQNAPPRDPGAGHSEQFWAGEIGGERVSRFVARGTLSAMRRIVAFLGLLSYQAVDPFGMLTCLLAKPPTLRGWGLCHVLGLSGLDPFIDGLFGPALVSSDHRVRWREGLVLLCGGEGDAEVVGYFAAGHEADHDAS